jgi:hypothetical protein
LQNQSNHNKPLSEIRVANLIPFCREIQNSMSQLMKTMDPINEAFFSESDQFIIAEIDQKLNKKLRSINNSLKRKRTIPARLPLPSYRAYIWISYLAEKDHLMSHLQALADFFRLTNETQMRNPILSRYRRHPVNLTIFYIPYIYRTQVKGYQIDLTIHEPMIAAPTEIKRDLLLAALDGNKASLRTIKKYCSSVPYHRMETMIRGITSAPSSSPAGINVDLNLVFDRVNLEYFQGVLEKPQLSWSQKKSYRRLGTYAAQTDTVTISRTFDDGSSPDYAVDFIMYHELLHKKMGVKRANSGKHNHTKIFKEYEKRFRFFAQANEFINHLANSKR